MISTTIYDRLNQVCGSLVGGGSFSDDFSDDFSNGNSRIYPVYAAQDPALPYVVYDITADEDNVILGGRTGAQDVTFSVHCNAVQHGTAKTIAASVVSGLSGWRDLSVGVLACVKTEGSSEPLENDKGYGVDLQFHLITGAA